jgi:hypothetical protein
MRRRHPEPEHYSWNLGTPDNAHGTEVIVNPYGNESSGRLLDRGFCLKARVKP